MTTDLSYAARQAAPAVTSPTRPMYWSVRRELWENRSVYLAPLIVAAVVLFGSLIATMGLPRKMRNLPNVEPAKQHSTLVRPFSMAPAPIMLTTFLVGLFYSLDALYSERRDRSILFWKSLPLSDRMTVLSKVSIPIVVLPAIALALSIVVQVMLMVASTFVLIGSGLSPLRLWSELEFFQNVVIMTYGLTVHALWFAPVYAWLLLLSAWAKRAPFLWAVLPPLALGAVERIVFGSTRFISWLGYRVTGAMKEGFGKAEPGGDFHLLAQLEPGRYLAAPGLWLGLLFAALFVALAIRLRRNREPI